MFGGLLQRLGRRSSSANDAAAQSEAVVEPTTQPTGMRGEVEFAAYAEDCRIFGFARFDAERMSDALNDAETYELVDVLVTGLDGQRATEMRELTVTRDEILAVRAAGPRGNPGRRGRTRASPVTLVTGPYTIHGYLHAPPGADPIVAIRRRKPMVALTEAWIEYATNADAHRARVGTIIVNREALDWIRLSKDEEVRQPDLPAESAVDPRAKDLTGYIFTGGGSPFDVR